MKPLSIHLRNFRSHEDTSYEFVEGATVIVGGNGEGKSSLLMGAYVALFGGPLASLLKDDGASTEMLCEFVFEHGGEVYRVRRSYSARSVGKSSLDFDRRIPDFEDDSISMRDCWFALTLGNQKDTQQLIDDTLGVSRETLAASAFAAQRETAVFCQMPARDRKAILAKILGLDQYGRLERIARDKASVTGTQITRLEAVIEAAEQELSERSLYQSELETYMSLKTANTLALDEARKQLALVDEAVARWRESHASIQTLRDSAASAQARLRSAQARAASLEQRITDLRGRQEGLANLAHADVSEEDAREALRLARVIAEKRRAEREAYDAAWRAEGEASAELRRVDAVVAAAESVLEETERHIAAARKPGAPCALCGQETHGEAHAKTLATLEAVQQQREADLLAAKTAQFEAGERHAATMRTTLEATAPGPMPDIEAAEKRLQEALDAKNAQASLGQTQEAINTALEDLDDAERECDAAAEEIGGLHQRLAAVNESDPPDRAPTATRVATLEREASRLDQDITAARTSLQRLQRVAADAHTNANALAEAHEAHATHTALARAYGRDGIPALILETTAIPNIETEANRVLATIDSPYRVELRTQRALKTRDTLAEALDVVIHTPQGTERLFESFSGGEQTRIAIALRVALAQLLAQNRTADVRLLTLDEPEALDTAGAEALARLAHDLTTTFDTVILVAHDERVIDRFTNILRVTRDKDGTSRITTGIEVAA